MTVQPVGDDMTDICERLRRWTHAPDAQPASDLMDEAAAEIERLRALADKRGEIAVDRRREIQRLRLTDDERQAIRWIVGEELSADGVSIQATLRGLLERTNPMNKLTTT